MRRSPVSLVLGAVLSSLVMAACGSSSPGGQSKTSTSAGPSNSTSNAAPTTTIAPAQPSVISAFLPRVALPFTPGNGNVAVTGDIPATAQLSANSCGRVNVGEAHGFLASLSFVSSPTSPDAKHYVLDIVGFPPKLSDLAATLASASNTYPQGIRFSLGTGDDYLNWGAFLGGNGFGSGTLTVGTPTQSSGSVDVELPFVGDDNGTVPLRTHAPLHVKGSWNCP